MKDIQKLMACISEMQQFDRLLDLVGLLTMSDEEIKELDEMDDLRDDIEQAFVRPDEISLEKVSRFNELVRKHFPSDNLDRI